MKGRKKMKDNRFREDAQKWLEENRPVCQIAEHTVARVREKISTARNNTSKWWKAQDVESGSKEECSEG